MDGEEDFAQTLRKLTDNQFRWLMDQVIRADLLHPKQADSVSPCASDRKNDRR